jgi:hypothetical protein
MDHGLRCSDDTERSMILVGVGLSGGFYTKNDGIWGLFLVALFN